MSVQHLGKYCFSLLISAWIVSGLFASAAKSQNILYVRVDTMTLTSVPADVYLNVYGRLTTTHPVDFYGFTSTLQYDTSKIRAVGVDFLGSAAENAQYHVGNSRPFGLADQVRAVVLNQSGSPLNLANPILYAVRFSVRASMTDTAWIRNFDFDALKSQTHVDSIVMIDGWIRYQPPVVPPVKIDVSLTSTDTTVKSDSDIYMPIRVSNLSGVSSKAVLFSFEYNTEVLSFKDAAAGQLDSSNLASSVEVNGNQVTVRVRNANEGQYLMGSGVLTVLHFRARKREDTTCVSLQQPFFASISGEGLIKSTTYSLGNVCVEGESVIPEKSVEKGRISSLRIGNPFGATLSVSIGQNEVIKSLSLFDALGRESRRLELTGPGQYGIGNLPTGTYTASVQTDHGTEIVKLLHLP